MDITTVTDGIAIAAATVTMTPPLTSIGYVPDSVTEPMGFCADTDIEFDKSYGRGMDKLTIVYRVLVSRADDRASSAYLDALMKGTGVTSLKAAIEATRGGPGSGALSGAADDLHVTRATARRWYVHNGVTYLGGELTIVVIGSGA